MALFHFISNFYYYGEKMGFVAEVLMMARVASLAFGLETYSLEL